MFDEIYKIAIESNDFEELRNRFTNLDNFYINARAIKNGLDITVGFQLALEGRDRKVEWMRELGSSIDAIASGYALSGNHDKVEFYRTKYGADASYIAYGYAVANNHDKVDSYHMKHDASVDCIASGYALAGSHGKVNFYHCVYNASVDYIAEGYALAGNHDKVEVYRGYGADASYIASGYELAGNRDKQKKYDINLLLDSYLEQREAVKESSGTIKEYFYGSFFSLFQKSFTQKSNAVTALKSALDGDNVDLSEHLSTLRNGNLGKELRAFIKSGVGNNIVGKEVTTVSDFVQALQDKNAHRAQLV